MIKVKTLINMENGKEFISKDYMLRRGLEVVRKRVREFCATNENEEEHDWNFCCANTSIHMLNILGIISDNVASVMGAYLAEIYLFDPDNSALVEDYINRLLEEN